MLTLNVTSITDEIFALTALRNAISPGDTPPSILTRDHLPALRMLVRPAFAAMVTELFPYVRDASVEEGNPSASLPYSQSEPVEMALDFMEGAAALSNGTMIVLKRYLEHLLALDILRRVYLPIDAATAASHATESSELLMTVREMLSPEPSPVIRPPAYF